MSEFDAIAGIADEAIFDVFSDVVTAQRGASAPVSAKAVIDRNVAVVGEYGQVTSRVTKLSFINSEWRPKSGDVITLPGGVVRKVEEIESDDGSVTVAVLYG